MNQLLSDLRRVWTHPLNIADEMTAQGRGKASYILVLGVLFAAILAQTAFAVAIGADRLLDYFFGSDDSEPLGSLFYFVMISGLVLIFALWWFVLPTVSRIFGGSKLRRDANCAFYLASCISIGTAVLLSISDVFGGLLQWAAKPSGSYFSAVSLVFLTALGFHQSALVGRVCQFLPSYGRALAVSCCSVLAAIVLLIMPLVLAYGILVGFGAGE